MGKREKNYFGILKKILEISEKILKKKNTVKTISKNVEEFKLFGKILWY